MKILKLLFATVATLTSTAAAKAADIIQARPAKTPPVAAPIPAFSWTGCHVGLHAGGGWGKHGVAVNARSSGSVVGVGSDDIHTSGALFGGQAGCDLDFANGWVVGLEGDIAAANIKGHASDLGAIDSVSAKSQWLASATGRIGYSGLLPQTLLYVKGGAAWVHEKYSIDGSVSALDADLDKTRNGWTVGGGIAWSFARNWSAFAEYNHYDFRNTVLSKSGQVGILESQEIKITPGNIDTVKVGLNYRFGG